MHRTADVIYLGDVKTPGTGSTTRSDGMGQSVARELSAMLFQFRGSCNRKDQLLENPWKALGESHGRKLFIWAEAGTRSAFSSCSSYSVAGRHGDITASKCF
ncbi:uncharacterized protein ACIBXB_011316 [Morphnus guianensis]